MKYRIKIIRSCEFEVDMEAESRSDAMAKIMRTALDYDDRDHKETKIVAISETPQDVYDPFN